MYSSDPAELLFLLRKSVLIKVAVKFLRYYDVGLWLVKMSSTEYNQDSAMYGSLYACQFWCFEECFKCKLNTFLSQTVAVLLVSVKELVNQIVLFFITANRLKRVE